MLNNFLTNLQGNKLRCISTEQLRVLYYQNVGNTAICQNVKFILSNTGFQYNLNLFAVIYYYRLTCKQQNNKCI